MVLATELEMLSVYPPAIRGERGETQLKPELDYLRLCMEEPPTNPQVSPEVRGYIDDRLALRQARTRYPRHHPLADSKHLHDTLDALLKK